MTKSIPVRVSIPASVAGDIGQFQGAVASVLDSLGCPACCSGHDIEFSIQRNVSFTKGFESENDFFSGLPNRASSAKTVSASIAPDLASNIEDINSAINRIAGALGCPACCSGHDLHLTLERSFVLNNKLELREQAVAIDL